MTFFVYLYLVIFILFDIFILVFGVEQIMRIACRKKRLAPAVPSSRRLRNAVIKQIAIEMPNVKTVLDIGSGWGTMGRTVAGAFPQAKILGMEIMPCPYVYSVIRGLFVRNAKFKFGNVFKYLEKSGDKFDVGTAYLLTPMMRDVQNYAKRFKVLIVLDFPLPDMKPNKKIKLHSDMLGQHWMYVYRF